MGLGFLDDVVPAPTVHAIAGHLGGPHEVVELPVSHTQLPEKKVWYDFEAYWFRLAVGGRLPRLRREKRPIALEGRAACSARVRASTDDVAAARPRGPSSCARTVGRVEIRHDQPCAAPEDTINPVQHLKPLLQPSGEGGGSLPEPSSIWRRMDSRVAASDSSSGLRSSLESSWISPSTDRGPKERWTVTSL